MKFLYYLTAIGNPDINQKIQILIDNLNYIYNTINSNFDIVINCYDNSLDVVKFAVKKLFFIDSVMCHQQSGMLSEVWLTNPHNVVAMSSHYDYVLFILDDVEIKYLDINEMIKVKVANSIKIISPKVSNAFHSYMHTSEPENSLILTNRLELFCYLMTPADFAKYATMNSIENKYMWGVDILFGPLNVKTAIYNKFEVVHRLSSTNGGDDAMQLSLNLLRKYGFNSYDEIYSKYPCIV